MRKRILIVSAVATLVLGGAALALAGSSERRAPSTAAAEPKSISTELAKVNRRLLQARSARVSCGSLGCVNRALTRLTNAVRVLKHDINVCERYINVTRYNGYVYTPDGGSTFFETTALDYTEEGVPVSDRVLVFVC